MTDTTAAPADPTPAPATTAVPVTPAAPESLIAPAAPAAPARPDGLPDTYWDEASGIKPEAYSRLAELEAADAARREGVPATAAEYKLEADEPITGPDGQPIAFDAEDPLAQAILPELHAAGLNQAAVSKVLGAYARLQVKEAADINAANAAHVAAEQEKLGSGHQARTSAIHGQVIAAIGAEGAEAIRSVMRSADAVIALEKLVSKIQGPAMSAAPTTPTAPASLADRLYANQGN